MDGPNLTVFLRSYSFLKTFIFPFINTNYFTNAHRYWYKSIEGSVILKSEVRSAVTKMKRNKTVGPAEVIEILKVLDTFAIIMVTEMLKKIYIIVFCCCQRNKVSMKTNLY